MIEKTTFSKKELQIELNKKYGIKVEKIEKINKGTANIFKIISNNEKFIVKEFQSKYSKENVLKEINAIEYLRKNSQVPLPIYLKNNNIYKCPFSLTVRTWNRNRSIVVKRKAHTLRPLPIPVVCQKLFHLFFALLARTHVRYHANCNDCTDNNCTYCIQNRLFFFSHKLPPFLFRPF